jgi:cell division protein FtsB
VLFITLQKNKKKKGFSYAALPHKKILSRNVFLLLTTLTLFGYICSIGLKNFIRYKGFCLEYRAVYKELEKETKLHADYLKQLAQLQKKSTWEVLAKQKLLMVKKGEIVYKWME